LRRSINYSEARAARGAHAQQRTQHAELMPAHPTPGAVWAGGGGVAVQSCCWSVPLELGGRHVSERSALLHACSRACLFVSCMPQLLAAPPPAPCLPLFCSHRRTAPLKAHARVLPPDLPPPWRPSHAWPAVPHLCPRLHTSHPSASHRIPSRRITSQRSASCPAPPPPSSCARGPRNNKGIISDWRIVLALPLFWLIDLLLSIRPVARALFDSVRDRATLSKVLQSVYR
jgi:hypothetical protein